MEVKLGATSLLAALWYFFELKVRTPCFACLVNEQQAKSSNMSHVTDEHAQPSILPEDKSDELSIVPSPDCKDELLGLCCVGHHDAGNAKT